MDYIHSIMFIHNYFLIIDYGYPLSYRVFPVGFPYQKDDDYFYHSCSFNLTQVFLFGTQNYLHPHSKERKKTNGVSVVAPSFILSMMMMMMKMIMIKKKKMMITVIIVISFLSSPPFVCSFRYVKSCMYMYVQYLSDSTVDYV